MGLEEGKQFMHSNGGEWLPTPMTVTIPHRDIPLSNRTSLRPPRETSHRIRAFPFEEDHHPAPPTDQVLAEGNPAGPRPPDTEDPPPAPPLRPLDQDLLRRMAKDAIQSPAPVAGYAYKDQTVFGLVPGRHREHLSTATDAHRLGLNRRLPRHLIHGIHPHAPQPRRFKTKNQTQTISRTSD
jgi:hypothetical protein